MNNVYLEIRLPIILAISEHYEIIISQLKAIGLVSIVLNIFKKRKAK